MGNVSPTPPLFVVLLVTAHAVPAFTTISIFEKANAWASLGSTKPFARELGLRERAHVTLQYFGRRATLCDPVAITARL